MKLAPFSKHFDIHNTKLFLSNVNYQLSITKIILIILTNFTDIASQKSFANETHEIEKDTYITLSPSNS